VYALRLLAKIVEMEHGGTTQPCLEWTEWALYEDRIILAQNTLCELGLVPALVKLIAFSEHKHVVKAAIDTSITLLIGGNSAAQREFFREFKKFKDSEFTCVMFNRLRVAQEKRKSFFKAVRL
jgi:hypothetical protein